LGLNPPRSLPPIAKPGKRVPLKEAAAGSKRQELEAALEKELETEFLREDVEALQAINAALVDLLFAERQRIDKPAYALTSKAKPTSYRVTRDRVGNVASFTPVDGGTTWRLVRDAAGVIRYATADDDSRPTWQFNYDGADRLIEAVPVSPDREPPVDLAKRDEFGRVIA
jgi:hypothetical protein